MSGEGLVQLAGDEGKELLLDAEGKQILADECCCGGQPCEHCPDPMPAAAQAVLSDIVLCTVCNDYMELGYWKLSSVPTTPNGTFELAQVEGYPCTFRFSRADSGTWTQYSNPGCTTPTGQSATINGYHVRYRIVSSTEAILEAWYSTDEDEDLEVFGQTVTRSSEDDCLPESFPTNDLQSCLDTAAGSVGYGGSGTVEAA